MGNNISSASSNLDHGTYSPHTADKMYKYSTTPRRFTAKGQQEQHQRKQPEPANESSRLFFLLYLLHRTWNVVKDKGKGYENPDEMLRFRGFKNVSLSLSGNGCPTRTLIWEAATSKTLTSI